MQPQAADEMTMWQDATSLPARKGIMSYSGVFGCSNWAFSCATKGVHSMWVRALSSCWFQLQLKQFLKQFLGPSVSTETGRIQTPWCPQTKDVVLSLELQWTTKKLLQEPYRWLEHWPQIKVTAGPPAFLGSGLCQHSCRGQLRSNDCSEYVGFGHPKCVCLTLADRRQSQLRPLLQSLPRQSRQLIHQLIHPARPQLPRPNSRCQDCWLNRVFTW